jgi:hypothetical protein
MADIEIGGKPYVSRTQVMRTPIRDFSPSYRTNTVPRRQDRKDLASIDFSHFLNGFGSKYALAKDERSANRFWDSQNVMTHWLSQISPSLLAEDSTEPTHTVTGSNETLIGPIEAVHHNGEYWGLFHVPYTDATGGVFVGRYDGANTQWENFTRVNPSVSSHITLAESPVYNGAAITITVNGDTVYTITEGVNFTDPGTGGANTDALGANIVTALNALGASAQFTSAYSGGTNRVTITLAASNWGLKVVDASTRGTAVNNFNLGVHTGMDITSSGGYLMVLTVEAGTHQVYRSLTGLAAWEKSTTQPTASLMTAQAVGDRDAGGVFQVLGAVVYMWLWDEGNNQIEGWKSINNGVDWTAISTAIVGSGDGPRGHALFPDRTGVTGIAVGSQEAVYVLNIASGTMDVIETIESHTNNCLAFEVYHGKLYVGTGDGRVLEVSYQSGEQYVIGEVGPGILDGMPTARQGHFLHFTQSRGFLVGTYGGHASGKYASVLLFNGAGWHNLYYHSVANQEILFAGFSSADDGVSRMHFWIRTSATVIQSKFQTNPLNNPGDGGTYKYAATGLLLLPEQSLDLPDVPGVWLTADADAINLGVQASSEEYITLDFGKQSENWQANELGHYETGVLTLSFGSGVGVDTPALLPSIEFKRRSGDNTKGAFLRNLSISLRKVYSTRYAYRTVIDAEATLLKYRTVYGNIEKVISELETIQNSRLQNTLKYSGVSVNAAAIKDWEYREMLGENAPQKFDNNKDTDVAIHLVELI